MGRRGDERNIKEKRGEERDGREERNIKEKKGEERNGEDRWLIQRSRSRTSSK